MLFSGINKSAAFAALLAIFIGLLLCPACAAPKGGIVILENPQGNACRMDFKDWSAKNKCELTLKRDEVLQVEILCESGAIALMIRGKNGSEPYTGNGLASGMFTVTVPEADDYLISISGDQATGSLAVKNLGRGQQQ